MSPLIPALGINILQSLDFYDPLTAMAGASKVGVIGMAVFIQKNVNPWTWMPNEVHQRVTAKPFATAP
jgi:hypothetical protein